jgi:hypothetical protein
MTTQVLAPPPVLYDAHGNVWVFSGMSELGPAYLPQQTPLPMIAAQPAPAPLPWYDVTVTSSGEGE